MFVKATYHPKWIFSVCRIYRFLLAVVLLNAQWYKLFSQEIGAYKTVQSGNFSNLSTWNIFDGSIWSTPSTKPNSSHDIYIDQSHTLKLLDNESVKNVYINSETTAGQKLNLNGFSLEVYGSLNAFSGLAPGTPSGAWNSQNWIGNSNASKIIFKGNSRIIIPKGAWSGFSTNSRYTVEFDPGPGIQLSVEEPFKASKFTIKSGVVIQTLDNSTLPASCSTFSFNNETINGIGSFGDFVIESGGTLISNCNDGIIFRSSSASASLFEVQDGGFLILEGKTPLIEASNIQLDGKIIFKNNSTAQSFLSSSYPDSSTPTLIHDLELQGTQDLLLPIEISLTGDIDRSGTGSFVMSNTEIEFTGSEDQIVSGFSMNVGELKLNKASGEVTFEEDLSVLNDLKMISGTLDLSGNDFSINTSFTGSLSYTGGAWKHVNQFTYYGTPLNLTSGNSTFPFEDTYQGGVRKVQLLGNSAGGNLQITFTEYKGAEYNAAFSDVDTTPILYRLYSYFQFSGLNASNNSIELKISADKLIVDQVDDLRIVGTGYAAPGTHLPGLDPGLWARRNIPINDLSGVNFTVGSYRTLSILPITWLKIQAEWNKNLPKISWELTNDEEHSEISIFRFSSSNKRHRHLYTMTSQTNEFIDILPLPLGEVYYQLKYTNPQGKSSWSPVIRLENSSNEKISLFPNPIQGSENAYLYLPITALNAPILITDTYGNLVLEGIYKHHIITEFTSPLPPGIYVIKVVGKNESYLFKLIKN
ncbi:T9SS type A sorting domain-containing protein [Algoriphagus lutimaris]|uniref:T9SS type A sorting domain-containing protein n=1 Tax=Algoriphagus lutimaris TaxID=613197 RepID=UPI00196B6476|nr:T9SS type A sorting domain-containing protein [Algoriphagus lutimaris]MBN3521445.1 T9SS type A sorting domain-containing protein [Algoriphagus lutimaris]